MQMKKYLSNSIFVVSVMMFVLALLFSLFARNKNEIFINGYKPYLISSGSMEPEYQINSMVIIKKVGFDTIDIGDVIAFSVGDRIIFHRIVAQEEDGYRTKGDNNEFVDSQYITAENLVGVKVYHTNFTANVIHAFSTLNGLIMYLLIPICCILLIKKSYKIYKVA